MITLDPSDPRAAARKLLWHADSILTGPTGVEVWSTIEGLLRELDTARAKLAALEADRDSTPQRDPLDSWRLKHARERVESQHVLIREIRDALGVEGPFSEIPAQARVVNDALREARSDRDAAYVALGRATVSRADAVAQVAALASERDRQPAGRWVQAPLRGENANRSGMVRHGILTSGHAGACAHVGWRGWRVWHVSGIVLAAKGPETEAAGMRAADEAAVAAGWRLIEGAP